MVKENKTFFLIGALILAGVGALIFYYFQEKKITLPAVVNYKPNYVNNSFIESAVQAPAVDSNIVNSGVAGRVLLKSGKPFEASLEVFLAGNMSKPFISVRTHSDGTFQIPLRPGSYFLKLLNSDGQVAPAKKEYPFTIENSQWLQVKIEYW